MKADLRTYHLYGLSVHSQWPLPAPERRAPALARVELRRAPAQAFRGLADRARQGPHPEHWFHHLMLDDGSCYLGWRDLFEFLVSADGLRIAGRPLKHANRESFQTYLLGQVLSFALLRQGLEPLHATVVVVDGGAVGLLGDSGYGKSSLGSTFLAAGYPMLTDDLLLLTQRGSELLAHPGPSRIKLYPETARMLFPGPLPGAPMTHQTTKQVLPLRPAQKHGTPVPLRALYVLSPPHRNGRARQIRIRRMSPARAFLELVRNTFNTVVAEPDRLKRQFHQAQKVACSVPLRSMHYPRRLELLPALRDAILADLRR
jgi:hypothetical protein